MSTSRNLQPGWAVYPGNTQEKMSDIVLAELRKMFVIGKIDKKRRVSAESAFQQVVDGVIFDNWDQQLVVSVPRIKAYFSMIKKEQDKNISDPKANDDNVTYCHMVDRMEEHEVHSECLESAHSFQDVLSP